MKETRYVHASSLCLDAPFSGIDKGAYSVRIQQLLVAAPIRAMERLIELCIEEKADFLILTGKLLTNSPADPKLRSHLANCFNKLSDAKIPALLSHPIHDPLLLAAAVEQIPGIFIFSDAEQQTYAVKQDEECKALVQSYGNPAGKTVEEFLPLFKNNPDSEYFQAAIMPFEISPEMQDNSITCPVASLAQTGFDAIIPAFAQPRAILNAHPYVAAPGPLLNRDFEQPGPHGCLLVHARKEENWTCEGKFKNLSPIAFQNLYLNVSSAKSRSQLKADLINGLKNIQSSLEGSSSAIIVNCILTGQTELNSWLHADAFMKELQDIFSHFANERSPILLHELKLETESGQKAIERDDLVGEVFKLGNRMLADREKLETFRDSALASLSENPEFGHIARMPSDKHLSRLMSDAMHICQHVLEDN